MWRSVYGKCSKNFPKSIQDETSLYESGYPNYRRRNLVVPYQLPNGNTIDNKWVVPYNPALLEIFNCHINVEAVSSMKCVKYFYKYVFKGHDSAAVTISESNNETVTINHDEIRDFLDTRYVGPVEAAYRIFNKLLQEKSHSVTRLPILLPNEHSIVISDDSDFDMESIDYSSSMLLEFFKLNLRDENARQYYYQDIPKHYTYKKNKEDGTYSWEKRQKHFNTIGRMHFINPSQIELFHERLLLLHVKGPTSFDYLKTVDNILYPSFTAACLSLGLIEDDEEWKKAMEEASKWMMPRQLRQLFIRILIHCHLFILRNYGNNSKILYLKIMLAKMILHLVIKWHMLK